MRSRSEQEAQPGAAADRQAAALRLLFGGRIAFSLNVWFLEVGWLLRIASSRSLIPKAFRRRKVTK